MIGHNFESRSKPECFAMLCVGDDDDDDDNDDDDDDISYLSVLLISMGWQKESPKDSYYSLIEYSGSNNLKISNPTGGDACTPNPCQNGGTCAVQGASGYACSCPSGYGGNSCETPQGM